MGGIEGFAVRAALGVEDSVGAYLRERARVLFHRILIAESDVYLRRHAHLRDGAGHGVVVRNGYQPVRHIRTGIGQVEVRFPKLRFRSGEASVFRSRVIPRYVRSTREICRESVWRFLHGIFSGDLRQALVATLGPDAIHSAALVPEGVRRGWAEECATRRGGSLAGLRVGAIRAECVMPDPAWNEVAGPMMVVVGTDDSGRFHLLGLESAGSAVPFDWTPLVGSLMARGLKWPATIQCGADAAGFVRMVQVCHGNPGNGSLSWQAALEV